MPLMASRPSQHEQDLEPVARQQVGLEQHADRHEEQAQQQPAERLDLRRHLMAVGGVRQQHAGQQGAERHGQAGGVGDRAGRQHDQQRQGGEDLLAAGRGDGVHQRPQDDAPDAEDEHRHGHRLEDAEADRLGHLERRAAQGGNEDEQGADREVLGHQDAERAAAEPGMHLAPLGQQAQHDRGRRQRQGGADRDRGRTAEPDQHADSRQQRRW